VVFELCYGSGHTAQKPFSAVAPGARGSLALAETLGRSNCTLDGCAPKSAVLALTQSQGRSVDLRTL